jgi:hypothetical protein
MCCGQKRAELRNNQTRRMAQSGPPYVSGNRQPQTPPTQPSTPSPMRTASPHSPVSVQTRTVQPQASTATSMQHSSISIRYLETSPVRVCGSVSGMFYEFSGSHPIQQVETRDASSLLNTRFFRRA